MSEEAFSKLQFKYFKIKDETDSKYLVYKDEKEFVEIVAFSAGEALEKSQIAAPYMVIHYNAKDKRFFNTVDLEEIATPVVEDIKESVAPQEAAKPEVPNMANADNKPVTAEVPQEVVEAPATVTEVPITTAAEAPPATVAEPAPATVAEAPPTTAVADNKEVIPDDK